MICVEDNKEIKTWDKVATKEKKALLLQLKANRIALRFCYKAPDYIFRYKLNFDLEKTTLFNRHLAGMVGGGSRESTYSSCALRRAKGCED